MKNCHSLLNMKEFITHEKEKPEFHLELLPRSELGMAVDLVKEHYLPAHVLVRDRRMDLSNDRAIDEYISSMIKQGNTVYAKSEDGRLAGICVGFASSPVDARNLRTYAFYRQDPNTKDFLYFLARLQETPNLWETFKQSKIFEIKMVTVVPEFRRLGLASMLVDAAKTLAYDQGYSVTRFDCINEHDFKVAERCMLRCVVSYPLHRLRSTHAPFVRSSSPHNCCVRVYAGTRPGMEKDTRIIKEKQRELEDMLE
ncbi:hypothetical protein NE865_10177 [Phthorimaea operculella]|nr:hypothetical protein NE865_10177 [Phthorimaea operculella]